MKLAITGTSLAELQARPDSAEVAVRLAAAEAPVETLHKAQDALLPRIVPQAPGQDERGERIGTESGLPPEEPLTTVVVRIEHRTAAGPCAAARGAFDIPVV